jgi:hypothetical protein
LTTLVTKAAARKAVIERPSSDVHQDAERTGLTLVGELWPMQMCPVRTT